MSRRMINWHVLYVHHLTTVTMSASGIGKLANSHLRLSTEIGRVGCLGTSKSYSVSRAISIFGLTRTHQAFSLPRRKQTRRRRSIICCGKHFLTVERSLRGDFPGRLNRKIYLQRGHGICTMTFGVISQTTKIRT